MAQHNLNYTIGINADITQAKTQIEKLYQSLNKVQNGANANSRLLAITPQIEQSAKAAGQLKTALQNAVDVDTGKLNLNKFMRQLSTTGTNLNTLRTQLLAAGYDGQESLRQLSEALATASAKSLNLNSSFSTFLNNLGKTAVWQLQNKLINTFVGKVQECISYVQKLDNSLNDIQVVSGLSTDTMTKFTKEAQKAAKALSATTTSFVDATKLYFQQGDSMAMAIEKASISMKAANVSFNSSAADMTEYLTAIWNSYQVGEDELERYVDIMAKLGATTATSMEEIATSMQKVGATANTVGVSMGQMSSIIATVSSVTRESAETIGTSFKTILARIGDLKLGETLEDGVNLGQVSSSLQKIGVNILDTSGNLKDMGTVIEELGEKWKVLTTAQQTAVAQSIAGKRQYTQWIALMENFDKYQQNVNVAENSSGTLEEQQKTWKQSWEATQQELKLSWQDLFESLKSNNGLKGLTKMFSGIIDQITKLTESLGGLGPILTLLAAKAMNSFGSKGLISKNIGNLTANIKTALGVYGSQVNSTLIQESNRLSQAAPLETQDQRYRREDTKELLDLKIGVLQKNKGADLTEQQIVELDKQTALLREAQEKRREAAQIVEEIKTNPLEINTDQLIIKMSQRSTQTVELDSLKNQLNSTINSLKRNEQNKQNLLKNYAPNSDIIKFFDKTIAQYKAKKTELENAINDIQNVLYTPPTHVSSNTGLFKQEIDNVNNSVNELQSAYEKMAQVKQAAANNPNDSNLANQLAQETVNLNIAIEEQVLAWQNLYAKTIEYSVRLEGAKTRMTNALTQTGNLTPQQMQTTAQNSLAMQFGGIEKIPEVLQQIVNNPGWDDAKAKIQEIINALDQLMLETRNVRNDSSTNLQKLGVENANLEKAYVDVTNAVKKLIAAEQDKMTVQQQGVISTKAFSDTLVQATSSLVSAATSTYMMVSAVEQLTKGEGTLYSGIMLVNGVLGIYKGLMGVLNLFKTIDVGLTGAQTGAEAAHNRQQGANIVMTGQETIAQSQLNQQKILGMSLSTAGRVALIASLAIAAVAIATTVKMTKAEEKRNKALEEANANLQLYNASNKELTTNLEKAGNAMAQFKSIVSDTTLSISEQTVKLRELFKEYGITVSSVDVAAGSYQKYSKQLQIKIKEELESNIGLLKGRMGVSAYENVIARRLNTWASEKGDTSIFDRNEGWLGEFNEQKKIKNISMSKEEKAAWKAFFEEYQEELTRYGFTLTSDAREGSMGLDTIASYDDLAEQNIDLRREQFGNGGAIIGSTAGAITGGIVGGIGGTAATYGVATPAAITAGTAAGAAAGAVTGQAAGQVIGTGVGWVQNTFGSNEDALADSLTDAQSVFGLYKLLISEQNGIFKDLDGGYYSELINFVGKTGDAKTFYEDLKSLGPLLVQYSQLYYTLTGSDDDGVDNWTKLMSDEIVSLQDLKDMWYQAAKKTNEEVQGLDIDRDPMAEALAYAEQLMQFESTAESAQIFAAEARLAQQLASKYGNEENKAELQERFFNILLNEDLDYDLAIRLNVSDISVDLEDNSVYISDETKSFLQAQINKELAKEKKAAIVELSEIEIKESDDYNLYQQIRDSKLFSHLSSDKEKDAEVKKFIRMTDTERNLYLDSLEWEATVETIDANRDLLANGAAMLANLNQSLESTKASIVDMVWSNEKIREDLNLSGSEQGNEVFGQFETRAQEIRKNADAIKEFKNTYGTASLWGEYTEFFQGSGEELAQNKTKFVNDFINTLSEEQKTEVLKDLKVSSWELLMQSDKDIEQLFENIQKNKYSSYWDNTNGVKEEYDGMYQILLDIDSEIAQTQDAIDAAEVAQIGDEFILLEHKIMSAKNAVDEFKTAMTTSGDVSSDTLMTLQYYNKELGDNTDVYSKYYMSDTEEWVNYCKAKALEYYDFILANEELTKEQRNYYMHERNMAEQQANDLVLELYRKRVDQILEEQNKLFSTLDQVRSILDKLSSDTPSIHLLKQEELALLKQQLAEAGLDYESFIKRLEGKSGASTREQLLALADAQAALARQEAIIKSTAANKIDELQAKDLDYSISQYNVSNYFDENGESKNIPVLAQARLKFNCPDGSSFTCNQNDVLSCQFDANGNLTIKTKDAEGNELDAIFSKNTMQLNGMSSDITAKYTDDSVITESNGQFICKTAYGSVSFDPSQTSGVLDLTQKGKVVFRDGTNPNMPIDVVGQLSSNPTNLIKNENGSYAFSQPINAQGNVDFTAYTATNGIQKLNDGTLEVQGVQAIIKDGVCYYSGIDTEGNLVSWSTEAGDSVMTGNVKAEIQNGVVKFSTLGGEYYDEQAGRISINGVPIDPVQVSIALMNENEEILSYDNAGYSLTFRDQSIIVHVVADDPDNLLSLFTSTNQSNTPDIAPESELHHWLEEEFSYLRQKFGPNLKSMVENSEESYTLNDAYKFLGSNLLQGEQQDIAYDIDDYFGVGTFNFAKFINNLMKESDWDDFYFYNIIKDLQEMEKNKQFEDYDFFDERVGHLLNLITNEEFYKAYSSNDVEVLNEYIDQLIQAWMQTDEDGKNNLTEIENEMNYLIENGYGNVAQLFLQELLNTQEADNNALYQIGQYLIEGLIAGCEDDQNKIISLVQALGYNTLEELKSVWGIASPSKESAKIMQWFMAGLINELDTEASEVYNKMNKFGAKIMQSFASGFKKDTFKITDYLDTNPVRKTIDALVTDWDVLLNLDYQPESENDENQYSYSKEYLIQRALVAMAYSNHQDEDLEQFINSFDFGEWFMENQSHLTAKDINAFLTNETNQDELGTFNREYDNVYQNTDSASSGYTLHNFRDYNAGLNFDYNGQSYTLKETVTDDGYHYALIQNNEDGQENTLYQVNKGKDERLFKDDLTNDTMSAYEDELSALVVDMFYEASKSQLLLGGNFTSLTNDPNQVMFYQNALDEAKKTLGYNELSVEQLQAKLADPTNVDLLWAEFENQMNKSYNSMVFTAEQAWAKAEDYYLSYLSDVEQLDEEAAEKALDRWENIWSAVGKIRAQALGEDPYKDIGGLLTRQEREALMAQYLTNNEILGTNAYGDTTFASDKFNATAMFKFLTGSAEDFDAVVYTPTYNSQTQNQTGIARFLYNEQGNVIGTESAILSDNIPTFDDFQDNAKKELNDFVNDQMSQSNLSNGALFTLNGESYTGLRVANQIANAFKSNTTALTTANAKDTFEQLYGVKAEDNMGEFREFSQMLSYVQYLANADTDFWSTVDGEDGVSEAMLSSMKEDWVEAEMSKITEAGYAEVIQDAVLDYLDYLYLMIGQAQNEADVVIEKSKSVQERAQTILDNQGDVSQLTLEQRNQYNADLEEYKAKDSYDLYYRAGVRAAEAQRYSDIVSAVLTENPTDGYQVINGQLQTAEGKALTYDAALALLAPETRDRITSAYQTSVNSNLDTLIQNVASNVGIDDNSIIELMEQTKQSENFTQLYNESGYTEEQKDFFAFEIVRKSVEAQAALEELAETSEETWDTLAQGPKEGKKATTAWLKAVKSIRKTLSQLFGVNVELITDEFINKNIESIEQLTTAEGEEYIKLERELRRQLATDIAEGMRETGDQLKTESKNDLNAIDNIEIDTTSAESAILDITEAFAQLSEDPNLTIIPDIDSSPVLQAFEALLASGDMTVDELQHIFEAFQWEPEIYYTETTVDTSNSADIDGQVNVDGIPYTDINGEVQTKTKGTMLIPHLKSAARTPSVSRAPATKKSGGGGGSKKETHDKQEGNRYHQIEREIKDQTNAIDRLEKAKERAYGARAVANINKEIKAHKELIKLYEREKEEAENYLPGDYADMIKQMASFNDTFGTNFSIDVDAVTGEIQNYQDLNNMMVEKYNEYANKEMDSDEWKEYEEDWKDLEEAVQQYEDTLDKIDEMNDNLIEQMDILSTKTKDALSENLDYKIAIDDDDLAILEHYAGLYEDILDKQDSIVKGYLQQANIYEDQMAQTAGTMLEAINKYQNNELNQSDLVDLLQSDNSKLLDYISNLAEVQDNINEAYANAIDLAKEDMDVQTGVIENISSAIDNYITIASLLGRGTDNKYLMSLQKAQEKTNEALLRTQQQYYAELEQQFKELQNKMNPDGTFDFEADKAHYETLLQEVQDAQQQVLSTAQTTLEELQTIYETGIDQIFIEFQDTMLGLGNTFDDLSKDYEYYTSVAQDTLTTAKELHDINALNTKIDESAIGAVTAASKQRLLALQDEINAEAQKRKLTEYDIEMYNLQYELALKLAALEDQQDAKDQIRLTRDANGNFAYQYTADQDKVAKARQEYEDVLQQINELSSNRVAELEQRFLDTQTQYMESAKEIATDYTLTQEQRIDKLAELADRYGEQMMFIQEQYNQATEDLGYNQDAIADHYNTTLETSLGQTIPQINAAISDLIANTESFNEQFANAILGDESIVSSLAELADATDAISKITNLTLTDDQMAEALGMTEQAVGLISDVINDLGSELDQIDEITDIWNEQVDAVNAAVEAYSKLAEAIQNVVASVASLTDTEQYPNYMAYGENWDLIRSGLKTLGIDAGTTTAEEFVNALNLPENQIANVEQQNENLNALETLGGLFNNLVLPDTFATILDQIYTAQCAQLAFLRDSLVGSIAQGIILADDYLKSQVKGQTVTINAEFPNANSVDDIRTALEQLENMAAQS